MIDIWASDLEKRALDMSAADLERRVMDILAGDSEVERWIFRPVIQRGE